MLNRLLHGSDLLFLCEFLTPFLAKGQMLCQKLCKIPNHLPDMSSDVWNFAQGLGVTRCTPGLWPSCSFHFLLVLLCSVLSLSVSKHNLLPCHIQAVLLTLPPPDILVSTLNRLIFFFLNLGKASRQKIREEGKGGTGIF